MDTSNPLVFPLIDYKQYWMILGSPTFGHLHMKLFWSIVAHQMRSDPLEPEITA